MSPTVEGAGKKDEEVSLRIQRSRQSVLLNVIELLEKILTSKISAQKPSVQVTRQ